MKLFRFPCTESGDFGVNLSLLDKVVKYKTIERFAETMAGEVTIVSYDLRLENVWCGAVFRSLTQHSTQSTGGEQLIFAMLRIKDMVGPCCVCCEAPVAARLFDQPQAKVRPVSPHTGERQSVLVCYP